MFSLSIQAQTQLPDDTGGCGTVDSLVATPRASFDRSVHDFCDPIAFDPNLVQSLCQDIYIKVNMHWEIGPNGRTVGRDAGGYEYLPWFAIQQSGQILKDANTFSAAMANNAPWNQAFHGAPVTAAQCNPIRYIINEVYFHEPGFNPNNLTSTQYDEALNVLVTDSGPDGYVLSLGDNGAVIGVFSAYNFVHEFGHNFGRAHTHTGSKSEDDGCLDTWWRCRQRWDADNDGTYEYGSLISQGNKCWNDTPMSSDGMIDYCDETLNGTLIQVMADECPGETTLDALHPCCEWGNQNNNIMDHSGWHTQIGFASVTPCQVESMLDHIFQEKCDMVEDINPTCPPTSAVITVLPSVDFSTDCAFTFHFRASTHVDNYRVIVQALSPLGCSTVIHDSGIINDDPEEYLARVALFAVPGVTADVFLQPDTDYRITLITANSCDTDTYNYEFHTVDEECKGSGGGTSNFNTTSTYPNPATGNETVTVTFSLLEESQIDAMLYKVGSGGGQQSAIVNLPNGGLYLPGTHQIQLQPHELAIGFNYLIFTVDGQQHYTTIVKQ